jgi:putative membrane protein
VLAATFSALHVLSLGIGLGAVFARGRALRTVARGGLQAIPSVLRADGFWGLAAVLWVATGATRLFGELDKGLDFYLYNGFFWLKMGLFATILVLEVTPMLTLIRWRVAIGKGAPIDTRRAGLLANLNAIEIALVVLIPFAAAAMARGLWLLT